MERLLILKLDATGCEAEALINGVAVARVDAARPRAVVAVHEYTLAGANRLELVVWPHPAAQAHGMPSPPPRKLIADGLASAQVHVLLPRAGASVDEGSARSLARLTWAPAAREAFEAPVSLQQEVSLPVNFPRWRWLDAPLAEPTPALHQQAAALVQRLADELSQGEVEAFVGATRLRTEELATAYQQNPDDSAARLRAYLSTLHGSGAMVFAPLEPAAFFLRKLAGGRLLECLAANGEPALRTLPDATSRTHQFPMRLAAVEGKLYVLR